MMFDAQAYKAGLSKPGKFEKVEKSGASQICPHWLRSLLTTEFFKACEVHCEHNRNECNLYCLDCKGEGLCSSCTHLHRDHHVVQIRRSSYHDVVRVSELQKVLDLTGVQTYIINSARVVFLNARPQPRHAKGVTKTCEICDRSLLDSYRYCSLGCKLTGINKHNDMTFVLQPRPQQSDVTAAAAAATAAAAAAAPARSNVTFEEQSSSRGSKKQRTTRRTTARCSSSSSSKMEISDHEGEVTNSVVIIDEAENVPPNAQQREQEQGEEETSSCVLVKGLGILRLHHPSSRRVDEAIINVSDRDSSSSEAMCISPGRGGGGGGGGGLVGTGRRGKGGGGGGGGGVSSSSCCYMELSPPTPPPTRTAKRRKGTPHRAPLGM